jgi:hypothetical protein
MSSLAPDIKAFWQPRWRQVALLVLAVVLLSPALWSQHPEAFTAQTQSIAWLQAQAPGVEHDPIFPWVPRFIYRSRSGVVDALSWAYQVSGHPGDWAYRALTLVSLGALLAASVSFARAWSGASRAWLWWAVLLLPGAVELGFFFNDNVVAAACAALAMACLPPRRLAWWRVVAAGIWFAVGILCRADTVLTGPVLIGLVVCSHPTWRVRLQGVTLMFATSVLVLLLSAWTHGFSVLDAIDIGQQFSAASVFKLERWALVHGYFLGVVSIVALALGGCRAFREIRAAYGLVGVLTLIIYPGLVFLLAPRATELRYILPLMIPCLLIVLVHGWQIGLSGWQALPERMRLARLLAALAVVVGVFGPPAFVYVTDGPRALVGRVGSTWLWWQWNGQVAAGMSRLDTLVADLAKGQRHVVVSTHYNDDLYFRLRLVEAGFRHMPVSELGPACRVTARYRRANQELFHVRTEHLYGRSPWPLPVVGARLLSAAQPCVPVEGVSSWHITAFGPYAPRMPEVMYPHVAPKMPLAGFQPYFDAARLGRASADDTPNAHNYGRLQVMPFSVDGWSRAVQLASQHLVNNAQSHPERSLSLDTYMSYYEFKNGPTEAVLRDLKQRFGAGMGESR